MKKVLTKDQVENLQAGSKVEFLCDVFDMTKLNSFGGFDIIGQEWKESIVKKVNNKNVFFNSGYYAKSTLSDPSNKAIQGIRMPVL